MPNIRLFQFNTKTAPVPLDIVYLGDSADGFNEVQSTIAQVIGAYPNLLAIGNLVLSANTFIYANAAGTITAGTITELAVSLLADSTTSAMQATLGLVIGTNVEAWSAALDSIAGLTTSANQMLYTTASNTYATIAAAANSVLATNGSNVPALTQTLPSAVQGNITALGTLSQAINMGGFKITNLATPTVSTDAVTKAYADSIASGFIPVAGAIVASTANLNATYSNGASGVGATLTDASGTFVPLTIDGIALSVGNRILVKNQTTTFQNGIYSLTTNGNGSSVSWVITRTTDYDSPTEIKPGTLLSITSGTVNAGSSWYETATVTTVGTDPILFSAFFTPSNYLQSSRNLSDVSSVATSLINLGLGTPTGTTNVVLQQSPTINQPNMVGVTNGTPTPSGSIGEYIEVVVAAPGNSIGGGGSANNLATQSLDGRWLVWGNIGISSTTVTSVQAGISLASAAFPNLEFCIDQTVYNAGAFANTIPPRFFNFGTPTSIYLIVGMNGTGSPKAYGRLCMLRVG